MGRRILSGSAIKKTDNETKRRRILSTANGKNHGGIADGVEYIGASALAGLGGVAEGIGDLLAAGSAAIGGNTERAKSYFKDNKVADWREDVRKKTNPGTVSGFLGDVAQGIGQSSVFLLDAAVPGLGTGLFFTGVSSQGISDAAAKTGDVGAKEIAYGIGSGAVEAITERLVGAGGQAASKLTQAATKGAAKTAVTKAVGNSFAKRMVWDTAKGAIGEGAEEFLGEYADTFLQRVTGVDKEAQYSLKDALYSAAVGAVSGGMMTAPASVHAYNSNARRGQALTESGMTDTVIRTARATQQVAQATTERFDKNKAANKDKTTEDGKNRVGQAVNTYKWNRKRKQTADFEDAIRDNLSAWDSLSEEKRNSKEGYALLGEIQGNLTFHEINAAIDEALEEVVSLSDEELSVLAEQVNRQLQQAGEADGTQKSYTVQDIREDRDGIATQLAALRVIEQLAAEDGTDTGDNEMAQDAPRTAQEATEQDTGTNTQGQTPEDILTEKYGQAWPAQSERDIMNQMAEAYGMEPALREQAEADYLAYGGGMDLRRFLMSYNTEAFLGRYNLDKAPVDMGTDPIPEKARENARKMGRILEEDKIRKEERERAKSQTDGKSKSTGIYDRRRVHMESGIRESSLDGNRKATVAAARVLANVMDTDIYLFMSEEVDGKRVMTVDGKQVEAPNGWIDGKGHIHIDLNAGMDGQGLGVFTLAHEATHFIRQYSPDEFDKLATFVLNKFGEKGADVDGMIRRRMDDMEKRGRTQDMNEREKYDAAYEEVVADAMEPMLRDGQAISELYEVNSSLFQKLKDHILAIVEKIKKAISGLRPDSEAGRMMAEMKDCFEEVRQRFVLAISVAGENRRAEGEKKGKATEKFSDRAQTDSDAKESTVTTTEKTEERKPRKDEYSTRGLLSSLIGQNLTAKADTKWISDYGNRLNELRKWQDEADKARQRLKEQSERVRELNSQIKELKDKPLDEAAKRMLIRERDAAKEAKKKAQADIDTCTGQVADADARLRRMEATETARRLISKAQKKVDSTVSGLEEQVKRAQEMTDRTASAWDAYHRKETERQNKKYDDMLSAQLDRLERERNRNQGWRDSFERGRIKEKVVSTVKRMVDMAEHPTKERNIPQEMKPYVAELIGGLNLDTVQEEKRLSALQEKIDAELKKADPDMEQIQVWERAKENIQALGQPCTEFLRRAELVYGRLKAAQNEDVRLAYDENVMTLIRETNEKTVKGRSVNDLSLEELREVKKTVEAVVHMMSEYRNTMSTEKKERISELAGATVEEIQALKKKNAAIPSAISWLKGAYWNELKPLYAIDEIGSPTLRRLFMNLYDKSERVYVKDLDEENDFYCSMQEKYKTDTWDMEKVYTFETGSGKVDLHLQQIMSLYAASKRAQYEEHIREGGFVLSTRNEKVFIGKGGVKIPVTMEIDDSMKYRLNEMQMAKIVGTLTESQRAYVEEMVGYLSTVMASKGNEVSLKLYGTELFIEPWYFPIQTAKEYRAEPSREMGDPSLKNMGMTKQTTPGANNPVMLSDFDAVWGKHCVDMAKYHSTVLPLEDFSRVMNWAAKPGETDGYSAVKAVIKGTHGRQANEYLRKMMLDLNGGVRNDNPAGFIGKMTSLWKKSATFCSLSVVIQQPTAIFRAKAMLDGKYFATTESLKFGKDHDAQWEQLKKYSSTASIKDMGFFDTGVGMKSVDYILRTEKKTTKEKMQAMIKDPAYRDEVLSRMPAVADEYGWIHIWEAVKAETADKNPSMKVGSEEFLTVAGQRFDEIVRYTQVYDSTLSKSGFMRSKDGVVQMATAFMAEPTTSVNMIIKAIRKGLDGDKKGMANWLGSVIASMIVNSLVVSLVYAMRDDDEDQTYGEKYWESAAEQLNPLTAVPNMLPFVRDIVSVCQGYEVERTDMSVITDVVGAFKILQSTTKTKWQKFETFTGAIGTAFGLPTKNILRDSRALVQTISGSVTGEGEKTTGKGLKYAVMSGLFGKSVSNGQQLYEAAMDGDSKQYGRVMSRFATEAQAKTALRTAIRSNDKRISYAADARLSGDTATAIQIRNEIVAEGHFPEEDVLAAINAEYNSIKQQQQEESKK